MPNLYFCPKIFMHFVTFSWSPFTLFKWSSRWSFSLSLLSILLYTSCMFSYHPLSEIKRNYRYWIIWKVSPLPKVSLLKSNSPRYNLHVFLMEKPSSKIFLNSSPRAYYSDCTVFMYMYMYMYIYFRTLPIFLYLRIIP